MTLNAENIKTLKSARDLLTAETWCRNGKWAADKFGGRVAPNHPDAVSFCMLGAISAVYDADGDHDHPFQEDEFDLREMLYNAYRKLYPDLTLGITGFNDYEAVGVEEIHAIYNTAIQTLQDAA